jgi:hypothetical protein
MIRTELSPICTEVKSNPDIFNYRVAPFNLDNLDKFPVTQITHTGIIGGFDTGSTVYDLDKNTILQQLHIPGDQFSEGKFVIYQKFTGTNKISLRYIYPEDIFAGRNEARKYFPHISKMLENIGLHPADIRIFFLGSLASGTYSEKGAVFHTLSGRILPKKSDFDLGIAITCKKLDKIGEKFFKFKYMDTLYYYFEKYSPEIYHKIVNGELDLVINHCPDGLNRIATKSIVINASAIEGVDD